ncbi:tyrosine--tRNA ligase [Ginsengibacter hankyongi]|uniref:Tyrosine--tRNA ligase n=1 Tax=Ginsengibacter hankyongi TaxID=2607284 RepID=A0A5J5II42_9BACT|nr:tyrosine--tRNA ligase [Ginsengibacter hankyongi]KAA9039248.1 tyrosine--tRNA ligase [Ginsengibacter hankyongi]
MNNLIEELRWRGLIQDIIPGTEEQLCKEPTAGYVGFDPTADSLHIGSLIPIIVLMHLQKFGHKPIALVGGATGMVGDPSGKSEERNLLSTEVLNYNVAAVKKQLEKFLDFNPGKENAAEMVNNYDWFKDITFLDFIRDVGKHISINYMMAKDSVRKRLEGENGMSFTEFTYQLVQGYDFYWLNKNKNCKFQFGGSDQWGNIVTGTELIRRKSGGEAFAFTCPLLTKADGGKFGKSEKGNVWLSPDKTSPYSFYQFWLNTADLDAERFIKIFTFLSKEEIDELVRQHTGNENQRILQKKLAEEVTCLVHSKKDYEFAVKASAILFSNDTAQTLKELNEEQLLQVMEGVPSIEIDRKVFNNNIDLISLLADTKIFSSKGEARKMLAGGGVFLNKEKVTDAETKVNANFLLNEKYLLVQKGKKNYYLLKSS